MTVRQFRKYLRYMIARYLLSRGYAGIPNLHRKIPIIFYGEKNINPFDFKTIESLSREVPHVEGSKSSKGCVPKMQ